MYDILFVGNKNNLWHKVKLLYPIAKYASTFEEACSKSFTDLFWVIRDDIILNEDFDLSGFVFDKNNEYDRSINHTFLNGDYHDSVFLHSKATTVTKREFDYGRIVHSKAWNIRVSQPSLFDVVFISYQEPNADENYQNLLKIAPSAKRVHGVKGIHQAHIEAAKKVDTEMFWVVDGDAKIVNDFAFDVQIPRWHWDTVHVWRSKNPINNLVYGYGGVKLLPTKRTINMDTSKTDMTTSITRKFKSIDSVSNITAFNTDPFSTWKSAFRECAKLASKTIDRQVDEETNDRLKTWTTQGRERLYGEYAIDGAQAGMEYGQNNADNKEALSKINDFDWLEEQFYATYKFSKNTTL